MSDADKKNVGGTHYGTDFWQTWNLVGPMGWDFFQGNIVKYIDRFRRKNGVEDLKKARHYLDKLIEIEEARKAVAEVGEELINLFKEEGVRVEIDEDIPPPDFSDIRVDGKLPDPNLTGTAFIPTVTTFGGHARPLPKMFNKEEQNGKDQNRS